MTAAELEVITRKLVVEAEKANRMADRKSGPEIEDVAVSSCYRGHAHGLLHAAMLLR